MKNAQLLHCDPQNYEAWDELMWANSLSHINLTDCKSDGGNFATHMLKHEVSGMFGVTHRIGLVVIWPSWLVTFIWNDLPWFV